VLAEVLRVVELARAVGNERIVLLQCTAAYDAAGRRQRARIVTLREATGCPSGSRTTPAIRSSPPVVAVTLGAVASRSTSRCRTACPDPISASPSSPGS